MGKPAYNKTGYVAYAAAATAAAATLYVVAAPAPFVAAWLLYN